MPPCWMASLRDICFVHLGKFGDIMIMLPAFKAVADETGNPPICIVSKDFASIFEGVSYVRPWVMDVHWWKGVGEARKMAESKGFQPVVIKWWDEPNGKPRFDPNSSPHVSLTIHGKSCRIPASEWDSYQNSQWRYAGFTMQQMEEWPLVFDRRSEHRESVLRAKHFAPNQKHLLINVSMKGTSPFKHYYQAIAIAHLPGFKMVNLATIKADRIYDLLGLYDHAQGLITSDTSTLHLAAASKIPYIAFVNDGGSGSTPKGNCILSIRYSQFQQQIGRYIEALKQIQNA